VTMYLFFGVAIGATRGSIPHVWSGALTAGLFYALNPWAMARVEHLGVLAGYALAPAVLATAVLAFRRQSRRFAVATGLLLAIAAVSPHYLAYVTILLVALLMWRLIRAGSVGVARRHLGNAALGVLAFLALEAFVLAPSIASAWLGRGLPAEFAAAATDLALGSSGSPWLDALMLTGNARWRAEMRPGGIGAWAWTVVGLAPAATLPVALVVNRTRRTVTASLIALAALPIALAGVAELPGIRPLLEAAVAGIPGGRALREPDKLLGLAALAYAWGVGMVAATVAGWGSIVPRRRAPLGAIPIVLAFVLVLVAYTTPAVAYFLWRPAVANWLPRAIPAGYAAVLDAVRADAAPDERVLVLESDERVPRWDATRLLRHLVTRAMPSLGTVTVRHPVNAYDVSLLETLADEDLADGVASTGAGRVIVARDTAAGEALAARLAGRPEFQPEATSDVLAVYRVARPGQPLAWATGALTAVAGYDPAVGRRGAAVVVDAAVGRCPPADPSLALVGDPALDRHAVRFACLPRQYLAPLRAGTGTSSDWQEADGSPAGLARWLAALRSANLRVTSQGYGLGFAWTGVPGQFVPPGTATFRL
ncbi:MAG: hypothetical protein FJ029_15535, partial [Actinobacteria bacterium]|nr:hypothetical protein [Actinomycetota bacterium]